MAGPKISFPDCQWHDWPEKPIETSVSTQNIFKNNCQSWKRDNFWEKYPSWEIPTIYMSWPKTSKSPMFRGSFQVINMRWRVQKLVFPTASDMIDQRNQLKQVFQRKIYSKTAAKVEKNVTTFGKNIHLEKFQPYVFETYIWDKLSKQESISNYRKITACNSMSRCEKLWSPPS